MQRGDIARTDLGPQLRRAEQVIVLAVAAHGVDADLAIQAAVDGRRIDADLDRLEIALVHGDRGRTHDVLSLRRSPIAGGDRRIARGEALDEAAAGKDLAVILRNPLGGLGEIDPRRAVLIFAEDLQAGRGADGHFGRIGLDHELVGIDGSRGGDDNLGPVAVVLEFDLGLPHAGQADRAGGLVEPGHAGVERDADGIVGHDLVL